MSRHVIVLALAASLALASTASANHIIAPGNNTAQLNPNATLHWGIPGPDALASNAVGAACPNVARPGTNSVIWYVNYWWGGRRTDVASSDCRAGSLHNEGRALDYFVNKNIAAEKAIGDAIFNFWRKSDTGGQPYVPMRRFGIQEVIWNCRIYTASNMTWRQYHRCNPSDPAYTTSPTGRHENHVHIGLNKAGAEKQRTAWTGYRPCSTGHAGCPQ